MKLKAFTLFETLIVVFIVGMLSVSLLESYNLIVEISFSIEQDKNLNEESLFFQQTLQTISETATIDYDKYNHTLSGTSWLTGVLYLTWGAYSGVKIYSTGGCWNGIVSKTSAETIQEAIQDTLFQYSWCQIVLEKEGSLTPLVDNSKIIVWETQFKIMPFDSESYYFSAENTTIQWNKLYNILTVPSFVVFTHFYSPFYQWSWNNLDLPLEIFFNTHEY